MWLLSTDRAELRFFASPEDVDVDGGYAILSHRWDSTEQSFQDLERLRKKCVNSLIPKRRNPRNMVCEKIRRCCELAEKHGYKWVWIDTCCIDKTSSTDLSEAINSMFRYYALARVCYAYLRDVDDSLPACASSPPRDPPLMGSDWFERGWTLQELIAPRFVLFLSKSWAPLGTKADFAHELEHATHIPAAVLRCQIDHTEFSIAQRMSWFGERQTARVEDEAYCLLGLFGIHMSPLYGEGGNSFRRLQEEILKQTADTTLFAWEDRDVQRRSDCLFAPSPSSFHCFDQGSKAPTYAPPLSNQQTHDGIPTGPAADDMTFWITPHGVLAYIPIIFCESGTYTDLFWSAQDPDDPSKSHNYLLRLWAAPSDGTQRHLSRPLYNVGTSHSYFVRRRLAIEPPTSPGTYIIDGEEVYAYWQHVLLRHLPSSTSLSQARLKPRIPVVPTQLILNPPFRFTEGQINKFLRQSNLSLAKVFGAAGTAIATGPSHSPSEADLPMSYLFKRNAVPYFTLTLGQCLCQTWRGNSAPQSDDPPTAHVWARVTDLSRNTRTIWGEDIPGPANANWHECGHDHVLDWPNKEKMFVVHNASTRDRALVRLSFSRCPISTAGTLLLEASLEEWGGARAYQNVSPFVIVG